MCTSETRTAKLQVNCNGAQRGATKRGLGILVEQSRRTPIGAVGTERAEVLPTTTDANVDKATKKTLAGTENRRGGQAAEA